MFRKTALLTGVTGYDYACSSEIWSEKCHEFHDIKRRASSFDTHRMGDIYENPKGACPRLVLHYGDLAESICLIPVAHKAQVEEICAPVGQSHVVASYGKPGDTPVSDAMGALRLPEVIRVLRLQAKRRCYQASGSSSVPSDSAPEAGTIGGKQA
ncbi:MAG TPA: GDP-mannose 4,6-dehydratase [Alphaproteobacteria bacterium]|nr:GDP-mannose 4,6-dehydratase [Alphaproteobacteria bacterium]